jgi:hypothetical protein
MLIGFCAGGRRDTAIISKSKTFEQLALLLSTPRVGQKDGSYLLRGGEVVPAIRADENLKRAELIVIDGDSSVDPETGEITPGAPPIEAMTAALEDMGISYIIHTSHSARPLEGFWKYRVLIPAQLANVDELRACVAAVIAQLHARGVWIAEVDENNRWSQPWYLPRVIDEAARETFVSRAREAEPFNVAQAVAWHANILRRERKEETLQSAPPISRALRDEESPIAAFNAAHGLEWVRSTLESQGYRFGYFDARQQSYRYTRPGSETKIPGVVVFRGNRGDWCVYSHHGAADPLSSKVTDPFALLAMFQHSGDLRAAVRAIKPPEQTIAERIASREGMAAPERSGVAEIGDQAAEPDWSAYFQDDALKRAMAPQGAAVGRQIELIPWGALLDVKVKWLVKDMIPSNSLVAIYGQSGAGKTFLAMYLTAMIGSGREAFGLPTEQGQCVYLALEGSAGLRRRRDALMQTYDLGADLPVHFVRAQVNLRSTLDDANAIIAAVRASGLKPKLLVVDTLARAFAGGDENQASEAMAFIAVMGVIQEALDCTVVIVHHAGKNNAGMRGSSAIRAACDAEIEIQRISDDEAPEPVCQITSTKQKDGVDGLKWTFKMELVHTSRIDPEATSLVVVPIENDVGTGQRQRRRALSPNQFAAFKALEMAIGEGGETVGIQQVPAGLKAVRVSLWRHYFYAASPLDAETKKKAFRRASEALIAGGTVCCWSDYCWIPTT